MKSQRTPDLLRALFHPLSDLHLGMVMIGAMMGAWWMLAALGYGIFAVVTEPTYSTPAVPGMIGVTGAAFVSSVAFNRVPKATVDAYLRRNRVMREAWESAGWGLGDARPGCDRVPQT